MQSSSKLRIEAPALEPDDVLLAQLSMLSAASRPAPRRTSRAVAVVAGAVVAVASTTWLAGAVPGIASPFERPPAVRPAPAPTPLPVVPVETAPDPRLGTFADPPREGVFHRSLTGGKKPGWNHEPPGNANGHENGNGNGNGQGQGNGNGNGNANGQGSGNGQGNGTGNGNGQGQGNGSGQGQGQGNGSGQGQGQGQGNGQGNGTGQGNGNGIGIGIGIGNGNGNGHGNGHDKGERDGD